MLYIRSIDDANVTHATASTTQQTTLCGTHTGRVRLDMAEHGHWDAASSTSTLERRPIPVALPGDVDCPLCAAKLSPRRVKAQTAAPRAQTKKIPPAKPLDTPRGK